MLLSSYYPEFLLDRNSNKAHNGKDPIGGIGGTRKNVVLRQVKSSKAVINSPKIEFCDAGISWRSFSVEEPHDIPNTLQIRQIYLTPYKYNNWLERLQKMAKQQFNLSCNVDSVYVKYY